MRKRLGQETLSFAKNIKPMLSITDWWGIHEEISPWALMARASVMFLIILLMIRIVGMRPFSNANPFDTIITILIGGILSRGVVGATPFFSTVAGALALILLHRLFSFISFYNRKFERSTKGKSYILFRDGQFLKDNMEAVSITEHDVYEELRLKTHQNSLDSIKEIYIEKNGELSFVKN